MAKRNELSIEHRRFINPLIEEHIQVNLRLSRHYSLEVIGARFNVTRTTAWRLYHNPEYGIAKDGKGKRGHNGGSYAISPENRLLLLEELEETKRLHARKEELTGPNLLILLNNEFGTTFGRSVINKRISQYKLRHGVELRGNVVVKEAKFHNDKIGLRELYNQGGIHSAGGRAWLRDASMEQLVTFEIELDRAMFALDRCVSTQVPNEPAEYLSAGLGVVHEYVVYVIAQRRGVDTPNLKKYERTTALGHASRNSNYYKSNLSTEAQTDEAI